MKEHLFDKRVVQRALQEGLLKEDDYQRMLDALPDLSDKLQTTSDIEVSHGASAHSEQTDQTDQADHDLDDLDDVDESDDEEQHAEGDAPTPNAFSTEL